MNKNPVGHPKAYSNARELQEKIHEYFDIWKRARKPLTVAGMACWLDVTKETIRVYERGDYDTENEQFSVIIKKAKTFIEMDKWEGALTGRYEKAVAIFDLKVNHKCIETEKVNKTTQTEEDEEEDIEVEDLSVFTFEELLEYERLKAKATSFNVRNTEGDLS